MFEIRSITADEAALFRDRMARGFGQDSDDDQATIDRFQGIVEYDRTVAVFDGAEMVGTAGAHSFGVTVPGGHEVAMAGTSLITVQPTHRRRGVLRSIMDNHLEDVARRGEPLAGLWASESSIYGRFGYGPATFRQVATMDARALDFDGEPAKGVLRLLESDEARDLLPRVYESARPSTAGMLTRSEPWWDHRHFSDPEARREGKSANRYVVFEQDGVATGYATYRQKHNWDDFISASEIAVSEVVASSDDAHGAIWAYLANIDLYPRLGFWNLPVGDPLPWRVTDPRRVIVKLLDGLWLRIMDVPAALEARSYDSDGAVTIDITDHARPDASGTFRLEVVDGVARCEPIKGPAGVGMASDVLGHLYLGGGDALAMAAAGRIVGDPDAVSTLHRLFRADRAPWCPEVF